MRLAPNIPEIQHSRSYGLLPFRFRKLGDCYVCVSETGESILLNREQLHSFVMREELPFSLLGELRRKHFAHTDSDAHQATTLPFAYKNRKRYVFEAPSLFLIVVTLRCDHSCLYCQVSRANSPDPRFDLSEDNLNHVIECILSSPSNDITVEFQGGEPLLAFGIIKTAVDKLRAGAARNGKNIRFTITSTLHHITDEILCFLRDEEFSVSVSVDGPASVHDANRVLKSRDSFRRTSEAIERFRSICSPSSLSALPTITRASLADPEGIVDLYVQLGFPSIFIRELSPYGFARLTKAHTGYSFDEFWHFYGQCLNRIFELNQNGIHFTESYLEILVRSVYTTSSHGYVDLRSPAGQGLGCLAFNYDGAVYSSDEGRMLAETGDFTFRLGMASDGYVKLLTSQALQSILEYSVAESQPVCSDCAYLGFCGSDPIYHHATTGDMQGLKGSSDFCKKQLALFDLIFQKAQIPEWDAMFRRWASE